MNCTSPPIAPTPTFPGDSLRRPVPAGVSAIRGRGLLRRLALPLGILLVLSLIPHPAHGRRSRKADWSRTLDRVAHSVMSLSVSATRPLDTESASSSSGTGFVVDAERGLLLTNRHMVHVGPVRARGITLSHEEIRLHPIYRDPVHDFGFYRFDPDEVQYSDLVELELVPEAAAVGLEIRVVGNDAGEKLSILDGTLARLDRPAPTYGSGSYNDFNTFYYQAATSTSGGSSGSPVVDIRGRVVALNAGGHRQAASSYYLPVDRAARALEKLQAGEPIPRGTLQAVYRLEPFDELRRLGLRQESESELRSDHPEATGMLVVRDVVPEGPADGALLPGDILVRIEGDRAIDFEVMESVLDAHVGESVRIEVERGGEPLSLSVEVDDLHGLSPSRYVEFSQGILQETSLQIARNNNVPAHGVLLVESGYAFRRARIWSESLVTSVADRPIEHLDDFVEVMASIPDGERVRVGYRDLSQPRQSRVASLTVDRRWAPFRLCQRDDTDGLWSCEDAPSPPPETEEGEQSPPSASYEHVRDPVAALLAPSLCHVRFTIPYRIEGVEGWSFVGTGVVVDTEEGLILVDRGTVPIALGDAVVTFAGSIRIPAEVYFTHPIHNFAILRYDPSELGDVPVKAASLAPDARIDAGTAIHQVGLTSSQRVVSLATTVTRMDFVGTGIQNPPSFREYNSEMYRLADSVSSIGAVLCDEEGTVAALWAFEPRGDSGGRFRGLPIEYVVDVLEDLEAGRTPRIRTLGVEVAPLSLALARDLGTSNAWIDRLEQADPERRQAIRVVRVAAGTDAAEHLRGGDILLAVEGSPITRPRDMEVALRDSEGSVAVTRLREGTVEELTVEPTTLDGNGVEQALSFAGALFHTPHWQVGLQHGLEPGGLYISWYWYGGPAALYGLRASHLVRAVNGAPVDTLDDFVSAVEDLGDLEPVRLRVESLKGVESVNTLETDLVYWPTAIIERKEEGWNYREIDRRVP